jgi:transposase InsO family protein
MIYQLRGYSLSAITASPGRLRPLAIYRSINALAENLWSTIKVELVYWPGTTFATRAEAGHALLRYIDGWYNPRRIQDGLGGLSPDEYEQAYWQDPEDR